MKPNFALSLYFDKVELLHRGEDGWMSVGEVAFDSADLSAELSSLRKTALTMDPAGLRTKLVLPDEQVKFLSLPEPNADTAAVRAALEDATPYALDDLVWEHTSDGRRTHVAAVARETLAEAEAFAVEHRFAPVSVVAQKVVGRFDGEPFFGETKAAAGLIGPDEVVERDDPPETLAAQAAPEAVVDEASVPEPEPVPEPEAEPDTVAAKVEAEEPKPAKTEKLAKPEEIETPASESAEAELPAEATDAPESAAKPETLPAPKAARPEVKDPLDAFAAKAKAAEPVAKAVDPAAQDTAPAPKAAFEPVPETPPGTSSVVVAPEAPKDSPDAASAEPVFASRSRQARTGGDGPATSDPLTVAMGAVRTDTPAAKPEIRAEPRLEPQAVPPRAAPGSPPPAVAERLARVAKANITADRIADMPPAKAARVPSRPLGNGVEAPAPVMPTEIPAPASAKALAATLTPEEPASGGLFSSRRQAEPAPAPRRGPPPVKVAPYPGEATATPQEQRGMTVFDQRADTAQQQRGRSRLILPILLAVLLLFMAGVAAFAAIFTENGIAGLFGRSGGDPILSGTPSDTTPLDVPGTPSVASTLDVLLPAASDPEIGQQASPEQLALVATPQGAALDPEATADPVAAEDEIAQADPVVTPDTPQGTVLSPAEAERFYAATGVWLRAPRLPFIPTAEELSTVSTGDTAASATERVVLAALVAPREVNDDVAPPVQLDPPAADVVFERDSRGLLIATAEGTLTPYGMLIYAGVPDVVPPTRPGTPLPEPEVEPVAEAVTEPVAPPVEEDVADAAGTEETVAEETVADDPAADVAATLETLVAESLASTETAAEPEIEAGPQADTEVATATEGPIETETDTETDTESVAATEPETETPEATTEQAATADIGLVAATPDGAVTAEGVVVFAGLPTVVPPSRPLDLTPETAAAETPEAEAVEVADADTAETLDTAIDAAVAEAVTEPEEDVSAGGVSLAGLSSGLRPVLRPDTLEVPEAAEVLASFAGPRPALRPGSLETDAVEEEVTEAPEITETTVAATLAAIVASAPDPLAGATNSAVATAIIPEARPRNFGQVVAAAQARLASTVPQTTTTTTTQATQPEVVSSGVATPSGPIPQTVAGAATIESVINLREINLIGVFGRPNDRRALIRLANGQYVRVGVGDALDGGQVTAIGDNVINYVKRGRTIALGVPG